MTWLTTFLGGIWAKLLFAGAIVLGVLAAIGIIRKGGADAARAEAATKSLDRTQAANVARAEASKPVTAKEEANDPFNRDRS